MTRRLCGDGTVIMVMVMLIMIFVGKSDISNVARCDFCNAEFRGFTIAFWKRSEGQTPPF